MKSFPKDVIVEELPSGLVRFKPIPTEETIDNLNLIDKSNKEITEHRFYKYFWFTIFFQRTKSKDESNEPTYFSI